MNEFFEHLGSDLREIGAGIKKFFAKLMGKETTANGSLITSTVSTNYEINLVPEVKLQMIKAQKVRNLVLFICIVVSSVAVGAVVILFGVKSGQDIAMANQDARLEAMSAKLNSYAEFSDLVTIQGQLEGISEIVAQKTVLSRVFGAMGAMLPEGGDSVRLSDLNVNLDSNVVRMDAQADARVEPLIDYRVLESFKKGVELTKYDYGRYVDADGRLIPTYCISETDDEGIPYKTGDSYYAWWDVTIEGCEATRRGDSVSNDAEFYYSSDAEVERGIPGQEPVTERVCDENGENCQEVEVPQDVPDEGESRESEEGGEAEGDGVVTLRVKIWRTPQFNQWLNAGRMSMNGDINNVEHFDSACFQYSGTNISSSTGASTVRWTSTNDCMLAPDGLTITGSANARDESDNLVLKFSATTTFAEEFFKFANKHMIAIGPMGQNVTDSYVQIGNMFGQEATECEPDDTECINNSGNRGGN